MSLAVATCKTSYAVSGLHFDGAEHVTPMSSQSPEDWEARHSAGALQCAHDARIPPSRWSDGALWVMAPVSTGGVSVSGTHDAPRRASRAGASPTDKQPREEPTSPRPAAATATSAAVASAATLSMWRETQIVD